MAVQPYVRVKVAGDWACFTRPETKVERMSYEVMTPSAARGILDSILWKPEMRWSIRRIEVLKPIRFHAIRRNELQSKISPRDVARWITDPSTVSPQVAGAGSDDATPRNTLALRDVSYIIEAEPLVFSTSPEDTPTKYVQMFLRRVEKGQCYRRPALGCREFAADFMPPDPHDKPIDVTRDLGMMLYDIVFMPDGGPNRPLFFPAKLVHGVLNTRIEDVIGNSQDRESLKACSYKR